MYSLASAALKKIFSGNIPSLVEGTSHDLTKSVSVTQYVKFFRTHGDLTDRDDGVNETSLENQKQKFDEPKKITQLSENGVLLSKMILKVKSKKTRSKSGLILLEGRRLINDACLAGITPLMVFFSRKKDIEEIKIPVGVKLYKTPYKELQLWSDLSTCPGIMALCKVPDLKSATDNSLPIVVICDQVREPGNLGAIIRNSAAAGVSTIILTPGCTDLWDPKVLRAGSGAHFKVPILRDETWTNISEILPQNTKLLIADSPSIEKERIGCPDHQDQLPLIPYYTINYTKWNHIAVVIGGETEGLSDNAIHLAEEMKGDRITIPMSNDIDSLNCAAAVSVILFEIRRQMVV